MGAVLCCQQQLAACVAWHIFSCCCCSLYELPPGVLRGPAKHSVAQQAGCWSLSPILCICAACIHRRHLLTPVPAASATKGTLPCAKDAGCATVCKLCNRLMSSMSAVALCFAALITSPHGTAQSSPLSASLLQPAQQNQQEEGADIQGGDQCTGEGRPEDRRLGNE